MSASESPVSRHSKPEEEKEKTSAHKLFVTNLDGNANPQKLEEELRETFRKYGSIVTLVAKRSFNSEYSYAFIEYSESDDVSKAVVELNNTYFGDRKMKVEVQDNSRRRKSTNEGCYKCGKTGHFARQCRENEQAYGRRKRSRSSRSRSRSHRGGDRRRRRADSSEDRHRDRSKERNKSDKHKKEKKSKHRRERSDSI